MAIFDSTKGEPISIEIFGITIQQATDILLFAIPEGKGFIGQNLFINNTGANNLTYTMSMITDEGNEYSRLPVTVNAGANADTGIGYFLPPNWSTSLLITCVTYPTTANILAWGRLIYPE